MKKKISVKSGQQLWNKAKNLIPGGTMLFSKRPELYLPGKWPTYYQKAKGCYIWDLDGNKFIDMSSMSVGTNILGYANDKINKAVQMAIKKGNISSLNCPEEVELADELLKFNKSFQKVRFTRAGGEANAVAIRIARAASGKDNVAFNGYHGWHDWYLSTNLKNNRNLNKPLLNNIKVEGVPKKLLNTSFYFEMNSFKKFKLLCEKKNIGVVKMELYRSNPPNIEFLKQVRKYTKKNKIILIFDECTSGFRESFGGIHKIYKIYPDILILGKALGNGYPINAILGKEQVMQFAQNSFISSTFWTERLGPVAALATLKEMKKIKSWIDIKNKGKLIKKSWKLMAEKHKLKMNITGLDAIPSFLFEENHQKYKTFITSEFLKYGFLATNTIYLSISHNKKILNNYLRILDKIFKKIKEFEISGKKFEDFYKGKISENHFRKIN